MDTFDRARALLRQFKGDDYIFGLQVFDQLGALVRSVGRRVVVVSSGLGSPWGQPIHERVRLLLDEAGVEIAGDFVAGARPNTPREDVVRIAEAIAAQRPDVVVAVGGGSLLDAVKPATAMAVLGSKYQDVADYIGIGRVTQMVEQEGVAMVPIVTVALAASSGSHLTKYANVTDVRTNQKKLVIDDALLPAKALFDYGLTVTMSADYTADGGLDGVAHCLEVFYGARGDLFDKVAPVAQSGIELIVNNIKHAVVEPQNLHAREALGLGTDLGGYAVMLGGTSGAHLTSFSLVDILTHGRACALMNPYFTVFFASAIQPQLKVVGRLLRDAGFGHRDILTYHGRDLGLAVAEALMALSHAIGFPTTLQQVKGFTDEHITRALAAAKDPQLAMKLQNMPVPLRAELVDEYMGPVLEAARTGELSIIRELKEG